MSLYEEKYLVIKMDDWKMLQEKFLRNKPFMDCFSMLEDYALENTFTIRTQDIAGAAGLRGYASGALITLECLRKFAPDPDIERNLLDSIDRAFVLADECERTPIKKVAD